MLTRRRLVQLGLVTWAGVMLGAPRLARAAGTDVTAPAALRRSTWAPLAGSAIAVGGTMLRLDAVGDLPYLAGRDDAFRLELIGRVGAVPPGIHPFRHPAFGSAELFVAPVDAIVSGVSRYEVVVDRSVGVPHVVPAAPNPPAASTPAAPSSAPAAPSHRRRQRVRRHRRRHVARHVRRKVRTRWLARRIS
jgi:hypothetical protein